MTDDAAARASALDAARSFIVRAPAGSGKTTLLTQRMLTLLATVEHPEQVVAITFTRKAAEEMRSRIVDALEAARGPVPANAFERASYDLAQAVLAHDARLEWDLVRQPSRLRIMTIDALCASLVRQMPLGAGMSGARSTEEDARELYQEAARNAVGSIAERGEWNRTVTLVLGHVDNDWNRLESLLADMLSRRDQWLRVIADGSAREVLEASYERTVEDVLAGAADAIGAANLNTLSALGAYAGGHVGPVKPHAPVAALAGRTDVPRALTGDLAAWQGLCTLVLTKDGNWRKRVDKSIGFPPGGGDAAARKQALTDLIAALADDGQALAALRNVAALPAAALGEDDWALCRALLQLLRAATAHLMVIGERTGRSDFIAVAIGALNALGDGEMPSDLALRMDYRVQHLLVDEFQDTSRTQYALIERLTAGWSGGDGRSLFLVGDPMQSIYRFRQAEVSLFTDVIARGGLGSVPLEALQLSDNFRSQAALVDWINTAIPGALDVVGGGGPHFAPQHATRAAGAVPFTLVGAGEHDGAGETAAMIDVVMRLRSDAPDSRIAILVRSRAHLGGVTASLIERGIAVAAREIQPFAEIPVIGDLLALTRALLHPADRIAWNAVLRAPWCGLSLASLEVIATHGATVLDALSAPACEAALEADERARAGRARDILVSALDLRASQSFASCVETAWLALGGPACVEREQHFADVRGFFRLLAEVENDGRVLTAARIERRIADLFSMAPGADTGAVQVMTIHRAKGLEFDYVLVPGAGRAPRSGQKPLLAWREARDRQRRPTLLMAPVPARGSSPMYDYLHGLDKRETVQEAVRLLYVALTRAREAVFVFGHAKPDTRGEPAPGKGSFLWMLWPAVQAAFTAAAAAPRSQPEARVHELRRLEAGAGDLPVRPPPGTTAREDVAPQPEFDWAGATAKHVGTVTHRLLQALGEEADSDARAALVAGASAYVRSRLRALGVPDPELGPATAQVGRALETIVASARGQWLLSPEHAGVRAEYALGADEDGTLVRAVIDRTFVDDDGRRWIVDFKTGTHGGGQLDAWLDSEVVRYRPQLDRYARIVGALEDRPIMLGLYFPLVDAWRAWPYEPE